MNIMWLPDCVQSSHVEQMKYLREKKLEVTLRTLAVDHLGAIAAALITVC
jgi:hypothetical protein